MPDDDAIVSSVRLGEGDVDLVDLQKRLEHDRGRQDLRLRKHYAYWILGVMIAEVVSVMGFFAADGLRWIHVSDELFKNYTWSASVVIALALWVTRSLFPGEKGGLWDFLLAMFGKKPQ